MADPRSIKDKVSAILGGVLAIPGQINDMPRRAADRLSNRSDKIRNHPFMNQLRLYAKLVGMEPDKIRHVFDGRNVDIFGAVLAHPTNFRDGKQKLYIGVSGIANPEMDDINVDRVNLVVGQMKPNNNNAYPQALQSGGFPLPVGASGIYYNPSFTATGEDLAGAFQNLAVVMRDNVSNAITSYRNARGRQLKLEPAEMDEYLDKTLEAFKLSPQYLDFLISQFHAAAK